MNYETATKLFNYNPETGCLSWKLRCRSEFKNAKSHASHRNAVNKGIAGSLSRTSSGKEYIQVHVGRKRYLAHRIAYLIHFGVEADVIDHLDGDGTNNKAENICNGTTSDNSRNIKKGSANTTGHMGVYRNEKCATKPWRVFIKVGGKMLSRGTFKTIEEAVVERAIAEREYGFSGRHGC